LMAPQKIIAVIIVTRLKFVFTIPLLRC